MIRQGLPISAATSALFLSFAVWLTALRYQTQSYYRDAIGGPFEVALHLVVVSLAAVIVVVFVKQCEKEFGRSIICSSS